MFGMILPVYDIMETNDAREFQKRLIIPISFRLCLPKNHWNVDRFSKLTIIMKHPPFYNGFHLLIKHFMKVLSCKMINGRLFCILGSYYFILCQTSEFILIILGRMFHLLKKKFRNYENKLATIFFFSIGFVFFDRLAINYLIPFIQQDFTITNTQIGMIGSALAITWAISGPFRVFVTKLKIKS